MYSYIKNWNWKRTEKIELKKNLVQKSSSKHLKKKNINSEKLFLIYYFVYIICFLYRAKIWFGIKDLLFSISFVSDKKKKLSCK